MFKKLLASAILLLLAAGTVFAGEKLIDHEKFTGKTTFTFKGDLKEAFHNEGTQVFQNYEIMPTVKGKNLKYNYKDENEKIKMTISGKTKEYTLTWTLNQECVIPKFTQPISEE